MQSINSFANSRLRRGFTLIELLVTIGIIVLLIGILIPVVSSIKAKAYTASTQAMLSNLSNAITTYAQANGGAFPGPISNDDVYSANFTQANFANIAPQMIPVAQQPTNKLFDYSSFDSRRITMAQNLVLGLLGGLYVDTTNNNAITYDPARVGQGPMGLNRTNPAINRRAEAYFAASPTDLSWQGNPKLGHFHDDSGDADDTNIPVLLDKYPNQMPILYLRAKAGAPSSAPANPPTAISNYVMTYDIAPAGATGRTAQYDISQIIPYTGAYSYTKWTGAPGALTLDPASNTPGTAPKAGSRTIGVGKKFKMSDYVTNSGSGPQPFTGMSSAGTQFHGLSSVDAGVSNATNTSSLQNPPPTNGVYYYPYDAYAYFKDPNSSTTLPQARMKDQFILISAGPDRVYGTKDDIVNFGDINP